MFGLCELDRGGEMTFEFWILGASLIPERKSVGSFVICSDFFHPAITICADD